MRLQMPDNIDKALSMAIVATNAEKEEKALGREDRGTSAKVFTVGGNRHDTHGNRDRKPRGKVHWSGNRGAGFQYRPGRTQYSARVDGTFSGRTDHRTPLQSENLQTKGGGAMSGPKKNGDRCAPRRPYGIQCYNCGLVGHLCRNCPRGQGRNLNVIGRTKTTPPSNPK